MLGLKTVWKEWCRVYLEGDKPVRWRMLKHALLYFEENDILIKAQGVLPFVTVSEFFLISNSRLKALL